MRRDNNLSHFCQIIFLNSLQAPNKERAPFQSPAEQIPYVSPLATFLVPSVYSGDYGAREKSLAPHDLPSTSTQQFIYPS